MSHPRQVREQAIGPFEYEEATECINRFAAALTNLGLNDRFAVSWNPRRIAGGKRQRLEESSSGALYYVILLDRRPDEPCPQGLSVLQIKRAELEGHKKKPQIKQYEAFGETKNLNQWAKAVGVAWHTLKARIDTGMTMEEALTQIALRKAEAA
jgi:hypothetical protein